MLAELCYCPARIVSLCLLQWDRMCQNVAHIIVVFHTLGNNLIEQLWWVSEGGRKLRGQALWLGFLRIQWFCRSPQHLRCQCSSTPTLLCFPPCRSFGHAAVVSGLWAVQCSWHVTKAQGGLLLEDCWAAYMAAQRFAPFLWSKVKCFSCSPTHHAHSVSSHAKYWGISGHMSVVWTVSELATTQAFIEKNNPLNLMAVVL